MSATIVILLLVIAIGLVLLEIFLVPGVGIVGIAGAGLMLVSLYLAYEVNTSFGHYTLAATGLISIGLMALAFRAKTWDRLSLKSGILSKVTTTVPHFKVGDKGIASSRLNPIGKAMINDEFVEVTSKGDYIDAQSPIEIINIEGNKIIVKAI
ncbi:MAG: NfeD family protein [Salibacteraceae bacterium]